MPPGPKDRSLTEDPWEYCIGEYRVGGLLLLMQLFKTNLWHFLVIQGGYNEDNYSFRWSWEKNDYDRHSGSVMGNEISP